MEDEFKDVSSLHYSAPMLNSYNQKVGTFQQVLTPEPIQIKVDSGTDPWIVAIGLGSIFSSVVIAYFSSRAQRNQIKANISNLRHHWMNEVRSCSSELVQILATLANDLVRVPNFKLTPDFDVLADRGLMLQIKLNLLLTKDTPLAQQIIECSNDLLVKVKNLTYRGSLEEIFEDLERLEGMLKDQLENAWRDIKRDYGLVGD